LEFVKNLSPSEAKYKYLGLPKNIREEFPEKDEPFKTKFKGKTFDLKVNNKDTIMLSELYHTYQFQEMLKIFFLTFLRKYLMMVKHI